VGITGVVGVAVFAEIGASVVVALPCFQIFHIRVPVVAVVFYYRSYFGS